MKKMLEQAPVDDEDEQLVDIPTYKAEDLMDNKKT
jgi:hypothetical protein